MLASNSSEEETANIPTASQTQNNTTKSFYESFHNVANQLCAFYMNNISTDQNNTSDPNFEDFIKSTLNIGIVFGAIVARCPSLKKNKTIIKVIDTIRDTSHSDNHVDAAVSTEPPLAPPTYNNVGCMADITPPPSALPLNPSPSPKPGPRPPQPSCPKKAQLLTPWPCSHQARSNVRLVTCITGRADAITSETPHWKAVPTDCFSSLSKDFKATAPGCTPLRFHCNQKGNLIITFTPTASHSLLMLNLNII
ncbi:hypothetical protein FRC11_006837 [Ceratobasidium sp. 423]|nr:hypothetical protein FRC11_006837 [Ceratobasidium sp. 423]